jgi:hypothetical protein
MKYDNPSARRAFRIRGEPHHINYLRSPPKAGTAQRNHEKQSQSMDSLTPTDSAVPASGPKFRLRRPQRLHLPGCAGSLIFQKIPLQTIDRLPYEAIEDNRMPKRRTNKHRGAISEHHAAWLRR